MKRFIKIIGRQNNYKQQQVLNNHHSSDSVLYYTDIDGDNIPNNNIISKNDRSHHRRKTTTAASPTNSNNNIETSIQHIPPPRPIRPSTQFDEYGVPITDYEHDQNDDDAFDDDVNFYNNNGLQHHQQQQEQQQYQQQQYDPEMIALQKLKENTEQTRCVVKKFIAEIWNRGEIDLIPEVCSPSLRFNGNSGFDRVGHDGLARMVATIREALDEYHCEIHSMVVEDNKAFCRLRFTGKHVGKLLGYSPTNKVVAWMGATEFTCHQNKILKVWELGDVKSLEEQLMNTSNSRKSQDASTNANNISNNNSSRHARSTIKGIDDSTEEEIGRSRD